MGFRVGTFITLSQNGFHYRCTGEVVLSGNTGLRSQSLTEMKYVKHI